MTTGILLMLWLNDDVLPTFLRSFGLGILNFKNMDSIGSILICIAAIMIGSLITALLYLRVKPTKPAL